MQTLRKVSVDMSTLNNADGSCCVEQGDTKVLVAVYGPLEVSRRKDELLDKATVKLQFTRQSGRARPSDRLIESQLKDAVGSIVLGSLHPRSSLSVIVQVIADDGSVLAASLNAICLALVDSGFEMHSMMAAVSIAVVDNDNDDDDDNGASSSQVSDDGDAGEGGRQVQVVLDPDAEQCARASSLHTACFDNTLRNVLVSTSMGVFDAPTLQIVHRRAKAGSVTLLSLFRQVL
jgi:exosome complex component RRP46